VLVINSYALNDTESHQNFVPLNYSGMNLNLCSSFLGDFFIIISIILNENCGKMTTKEMTTKDLFPA